MIDKITDHVYLSGAKDVLTGYTELRKLEITHILTVSAVAIPVDKRIPNIEYHFILAMDLPNQDLLGTGLLADGLAFMKNAVQSGGNVLVHCEVGVSRSVTVVAAYIMQKYKFSPEKALEFIKKSRPIAFPNEGFYAQLQIFEKLDYNLDDAALSASRAYKDWCVASGNVPNKGSDERATTFIRNVENSGTSGNRGSKFRCGRCRHVLFYGEHLTRHKRCDGEVNVVSEALICKFGYLIEPMKWMDVSEFEGKISCPSCYSKLGNYSWGGRHCQGEPGARCAEHVTPWVHLHRAKVDEVSSESAIERLHKPPQIPAVIIS
ncbi:dual specificity phosphatase, catalytic domain protein [Necator americanus]|uniref:protein-tyrosine-phosphatase n=1 Tax=Necator americanus TaxID=51031 RepID=W2TEY9_NECAM|nr:dual specificity phosphatase, catalytic domain protein [Necator americanus]ETN80625.1 dual specificity phosphatase, catalytic domain protein [Necator americanus]